MDNIIAIVSIITSGVVAISGILLPPLISYFQDKRKWTREQNAKAEEWIFSSTVDLLNTLALYRSGAISPQNLTRLRQAHTDLLSKNYSWEQTVWPYIKSYSSELRAAREIIEKDNNPTKLYEEGPMLASNIMNIARNAENNIQ